MSYDKIKKDFIRTYKEDIDRVQDLIKDVKSGSYTTKGEEVIIDRYSNGDIQITCMYGLAETVYSFVICGDGEFIFNLGYLSWWPCMTEQEMYECLSAVGGGSFRLHKKLNKKEFVPLLDRLIKCIKKSKD